MKYLDQLRAMDAFQNTLIFFLSDNGASAEIMVRDDGRDPSAEPGSVRQLHQAWTGRWEEFRTLALQDLTESR